jgi:predicted enzyme related to lactoylglutathione lyase
MIRRDGYIPGVPCWIDASQPDLQAGVDFYGALFKWDCEDVMAPAAPYFIARLDGGDVAGLWGSTPEDGPPQWRTYMWVDSADETAAKVLAAGGSVLTEPLDVADAGRMAAFADPEGATFCVWQAKAHKGAAVVNEPGSLNFNTLHTRDLDRAAAFYGAVFGWEVLDLGGGGLMWTLPGYCDFLELRDEGLRERMRTMGAPEGFEDAVASVLVLDDDKPDTPAHWGVTFGVEDADATAAKAAELGGQVVVAPFDAPWVRMAVIVDSQGATFTASQFVPPENSAPAQEAARVSA